MLENEGVGVGVGEEVDEGRNKIGKELETLGAVNKSSNKIFDSNNPWRLSKATN